MALIESIFKSINVSKKSKYSASAINPTCVKRLPSAQPRKAKNEPTNPKTGSMPAPKNLNVPHASFDCV
ncbi:hypothetical protein SAMN04488029_2096 [Reichenbachiella faecimaris]|uniref:Uncharacterized protein n=1 Tax=Reichenbachiella faecimaris TaxID=692418 RepID=A0A1W2GDK6_REIFA|nr:hypothetical protein SAMN04488029_2096 [Reichenbachiella faecimaris]